MELFENSRFELAENFRLFSDLNSDCLSGMSETTKKDIYEKAEKALEYSPEMLTASLYKRFSVDGNRSVFENIYHKKREETMHLLLGCICFGADRYRDKLLDLVWSILEETSWVIPAHNVSEDAGLNKKCLPDAFGENIYYIDLFSAATGALLALVSHYAGKALDEISDGVISKRITGELKRRIIKPFLLYDMRWTYVSINNWLPWITSNVLTVAAISEERDEVRRAVVTKAQKHLNLFVNSYKSDCGCNEGASYWGVAVGTLFDACEVMYDITGGTVDVFGSPFIKKACEFIADMSVSEKSNLFVNFADCSRIIYVDTDMLYRMGTRTKSQKLIDFASRIYLAQKNAGKRAKKEYALPYRCLKSVMTDFASDKELSPDGGDKTCFYPELQVSVLRRGAFCTAIKGGHNGESHNHNDVGHLIVYHDRSPVLIDMGNDVYRKETFNSMRYTLRENQSSYHNLPDFGGINEHEGKEYYADKFTFDDKTDTVSVSYAKAYPESAGVSLCERTLTISEEKITICESFSASGKAVFNYMLCTKPEIKDNKVYTDDCVLTFTGAETISCETVGLLNSPKLSADWNSDCLWRIKAAPDGNDMTLTITPGK